jgi:hypothetical protein
MRFLDIDGCRNLGLNVMIVVKGQLFWYRPLQKCYHLWLLKKYMVRLTCTLDRPYQIGLWPNPKHFIFKKKTNHISSRSIFYTYVMWTNFFWSCIVYTKVRSAKVGRSAPFRPASFMPIQMWGRTDQLRCPSSKLKSAQFIGGPTRQTFLFLHFFLQFYLHNS